MPQPPPVPVLDHTALVLLGRGDRRLSAIVAGATAADGRIDVPVLCLIAAEAQQHGVADHVGALPVFHPVDVPFSDARTLGRLVGHGVDWPVAQAAMCARPSVEWPTGRPVLTCAPETYDGFGVRVVPIR
ncbi:MAG TPA: hypothetical protein VFT95_09305 [Micromonosporaceae bacterium]|nr:hypothetical protein [Micromonosporaceae bacterium]